jgi:hypothetical protein
MSDMFADIGLRNDVSENESTDSDGLYDNMHIEMPPEHPINQTAR